MRTHRPAPSGDNRVDVSALLALDTDGPHLILGMFIVSNVVFTFATRDPGLPMWPRYLALVIVCAAGVLMARPHPDPFPLRDTLLVLAAVAVSTALISWTLPETGEIGRASWHLGSNMWLLWLLIIRGRAGLAWTGAVLMSVITVAWTVSVGRGAMAAFGVLDTQLGMLATGQFFVANLRATARRINALTERSVDAASAAAAAAASRQVRVQRTSEVQAIARPLLERIAAGAPLTAEDRALMREGEARLRDEVRGRSLAVPAILDATSRARARGVEVQLLDDRGAGLPSGDAMHAIVAAVTAELDAAASGSVTVRLVPAGREDAVTLTSVEGESVRRIVLDSAGRPVTQPVGG